jgi:hypothetical protein
MKQRMVFAAAIILAGMAIVGPLQRKRAGR